MAQSGGAGERKYKDILFSRKVVLLKNDDECTSFSDMKKIESKSEIEFSSSMTQNDVQKKIQETFPYLEHKRFSCAAFVKVDNDHKKFEFYGSRRVWDGKTIGKHIKGKSNLYILEEEVAQPTATATRDSSTGKSEEDEQGTSDISSESDNKSDVNPSSSDTGFDEVMDISFDDSSITVKPSSFSVPVGLHPSLDAIRTEGFFLPAHQMLAISLLDSASEIWSDSESDEMCDDMDLLGELVTHGQMTTNERASDPVCKDDISRDPADGVHSPMAMQHKMKKIVTATMKFEAEHEECVRVLPYLEGDQVVVQFYVFSGESGVPNHLKLAAEECFREMEVKLKWSDLYNDAANILKVTPLEYPSGEPKRMSASQVDEINEIISKNLHVLDQHRNVTSVQASFKITESKQTENPCITIYVLGKGFVPVGESEFPHTLGPYPVDVVDGFWFRTHGPWKPNKAQEQSEVLCLGASIGVQGEEASGTLGAIVEAGGTLYALSCYHVMKHSTKSEIIHPGLNDHLNYLKYHLNEYEELIKENTPHGSLKDLTESGELSEKFEELKSIKENHLNSNCSKWEKVSIQNHEEDFQRGLLKPPRVIGNYTIGFTGNLKWTNGKEYFVDAAIAKLTVDEINSLREYKTAQMINTGKRISGDCSEATTKAISYAEELCKSGRTTLHTTTSRFVGPNGVAIPTFMIDSSKSPEPKFEILGNGLFNVKIRYHSCQKYAEQPPSQSEVKANRELTRPCKSCAEKWCKNCLCIDNGTQEKFADSGDSGAVIFEVKKGLPGFGIIFAIHQHSYQFCVIASPLQVALDALSEQIPEKSNLRLVSNYVVPGRPTITKLEDEVETSFTFTWDRPAYDGGDPNIKYKVEWRKKPVDSNTLAEEVDNIGETSLTVSDLEGGEDYEFKVFAQNAEGYSKPATRSYSVQREDVEKVLQRFIEKDAKRIHTIADGMAQAGIAPLATKGYMAPKSGSINMAPDRSSMRGSDEKYEELIDGLWASRFDQLLRVHSTESALQEQSGSINVAPGSSYRRDRYWYKDGSQEEMPVFVRASSVDEVSGQAPAIFCTFLSECFQVDGLSVSSELSDRQNKISKDVAHVIRDIGGDLSNDASLNGLISQVQVSKDTTFDTFLQVAAQIFSDGKVNWDRIATLFYFGYKLAVQVVNEIPLIKMIIQWVVQFIKDRLANWIFEQGGWERLRLLIRKYCRSRKRKIESLSTETRFHDH